MYHIELTFHQCGDNESTWEDTLPTLAAAVERLEYWATGQMPCWGWINDTKLLVSGGTVRGADGEPLCTNPAWHEIFAKPCEAVQPFRPQPTRGTAPTNPASFGEGVL